MINNLDVIINELKGLRGELVFIFGQPVRVNSGYDDDEMIIDSIDILEELKDYEVDIISIFDELNAYEMDIYNQFYNEDEQLEPFEFESVDCFIDCMIELDYISNAYPFGDSSYNYSGYFSNHLDWRIYETSVDSRVYIELKVHRFGDARANYTDSVILEFNDTYEFYDIIGQNKYLDLEVNNKLYSIGFSGINDEVVIYDTVSHTESYHYGDIDDIIEYIKNEMID